LFSSAAAKSSATETLSHYQMQYNNKEKEKGYTICRYANKQKQKRKEAISETTMQQKEGFE
jgi:hypothetical protein